MKEIESRQSTLAKWEQQICGQVANKMNMFWIILIMDDWTSNSVAVFITIFTKL